MFLSFLWSFKLENLVFFYSIAKFKESWLLRKLDMATLPISKFKK